MPTYVSEQESVWNTTTSPKTSGSFDIAAGDALVAVVAEENFETGQTFNITNSGTALTWNKTDVSGMTNNGDCYGSISAALVGAGQTGITASCTRSGGSAGFFGFNVLRFSGVASLGTPVSSATARQVSITTTAANSSIVVLIADWSAAAQATRTYLQPSGASAPVEVTYFNNTANYTVCGYYIEDAGAAGAKTVGISNAMTTPVCIAIELVAASSGSTLAVSSTGTGTSTGSLAVNLVQSVSSTGTGTTTGSVALTLSPGALSATGSGTTTGSAALSSTLALSASGAGTSTGSLNVTIVGSSTTHSLSATGTGASTGSAALSLAQALSATGTGTSAGSLAVREALALSSTGTGQTAGSAALGLRLKLTGSGSGTTTGSVAVSLIGAAATHALSATGAASSGGSLDLAVVQPTFNFTPPTHEEPIRPGKDMPKHIGYYRLTYASSVVRVGGQFQAIRTPTPDQLTGLVEGVDFFRGGYEYVIGRDIAADLEAAGFMDVPGFGFGMGAYGAGPYGD